MTPCIMTMRRAFITVLLMAMMNVLLAFIVITLGILTFKVEVLGKDISFVKKVFSDEDRNLKITVEEIPEEPIN